jgi:hypothetical protein
MKLTPIILAIFLGYIAIVDTHLRGYDNEKFNPSFAVLTREAKYS